MKFLERIRIFKRHGELEERLEAYRAAFEKRLNSLQVEAGDRSTVIANELAAYKSTRTNCGRCGVVLLTGAINRPDGPVIVTRKLNDGSDARAVACYFCEASAKRLGWTVERPPKPAPPLAAVPDPPKEKPDGAVK